MLKDYRVTVKVRNNRILKAIEEAGGEPGEIWCRKHGLRYGHLNALINMTESPLSVRTGGLSKQAQLLCDALNKTPDDLWSKEQLYPLEKNFSEMEMSHEQLVSLLPSDEQSYLDNSLEEKQMVAGVADLLKKITPTGEEVLRLRFGLADGHEHTLKEIGEKMGVSGETVRQIEARALRLLRNPERSDQCRIFLEESPPC